eukprot:TRINITY_DN93429_c0_g1_i1.p1 TRINITY_DN93429_c0_g1~~TRINITY_DN93429_c0_g1_i1.p1  ORF type:complete len:465 (+),score=82.29 TRINITY_DN93429_c0_g1_i1:27-1421(+)
MAAQNAGVARTNSTTAIRAAGHLSLGADHSTTRTLTTSVQQKAPPSPRSQLLAQKPHGFVPSTPRTLLHSQRVAKITDESALQEMTQYLRRGGHSVSLPGLASLMTDNDGSTEKSGSLRLPLPGRHGGSDSPMDASPSAASPRNHGAYPKLFESTKRLSRQGTRIYEWAGDASARNRTLGATSFGRTHGSMQGTMQGTMQESRSWLGSVQKAGKTLDVEEVDYVEKQRPSTRELLQELRSEGRQKVDDRSRALASLPRKTEEMYKPRREANGASLSTMPTSAHSSVMPSAAHHSALDAARASASLLRQSHSMPELHALPGLGKARHATEASREYKQECDRLLRRLMTDADISHAAMPAIYAQKQLCGQLDKAQQFLKQSELARQRLEEDAGSSKLAPARQPLGMRQAGLRLPDDSPALPGSLKWQKPEPKTKPRKKRDSPRTIRQKFLQEMRKEAERAALEAAS